MWLQWHIIRCALNKEVGHCFREHWRNQSLEPVYLEGSWQSSFNGSVSKFGLAWDLACHYRAQPKTIKHIQWHFPNHCLKSQYRFDIINRIWYRNWEYQPLHLIIPAISSIISVNIGPIYQHWTIFKHWSQCKLVKGIGWNISPAPIMDDAASMGRQAGMGELQANYNTSYLRPCAFIMVGMALVKWHCHGRLTNHSWIHMDSCYLHDSESIVHQISTFMLVQN